MSNHRILPPTVAPFPGPPLGRLWKVPAKLESSVPRPEILDSVRACLLAADEPAAERSPACVLLGEAGSGKTTLAQMLAQEIAIRARFPDGVYWLSQGEASDLSALLSDLLRVFDPWCEFAPAPIACARLRRLLTEKSVLLILDALQTEEALSSFQVGGPQCRLLITTWDSSLAEKAGGQTFAVPALQPEQEGAESALLQRLHRLQSANTQALERFAWLGAPADGALLNPLMMATLWLTDFPTAAHQLEQFRQEALLTAAEPLSLEKRIVPAYRLPSRLHAMARRLLTLPRPEGMDIPLVTAHRLLLERYRKACKPHGRAADWSGLPIDGYIHTYLAWHMEQAEQCERIVEMLQAETTTGRNAWYQIRLCLGQTTGYAADVYRAWRWAHARTCRALAKGEQAQPLGLELRLILMLASLQSLRQSLSNEQLKALIQSDFWPPAMGLNAVRRRGVAGVMEREQRLEAILELLPLLPPEELPEEW